MNVIKATTLKLIHTNWLIVMLALPVLYGVIVYWYLGRFDDPKQVFFSYALYYNCSLPFGIALMISLYTRYEEQIGHFNHLLQLPRRDKWLLNMMSFSWVSVGVSTFISCVPLWLLVGDTFSKFIIYYLLLTTLFSLPFIIILWFVALKMNMSLCLGMGVFLSLYLILFGANSLGDTIWTYIPLLYGTRFLYVIGISDSLSFFIFSIFLLFTGLLLVIVIMWFNRWEGRTINE